MPKRARRPSACRRRTFGARTARSPRSESPSSRATERAMIANFLQWPFFYTTHRELAGALRSWAGQHLASMPNTHARDDLDARCRTLVRDLGTGGWTRHCVPAEGRKSQGSKSASSFDVRSVALAREILAWHDGLADFAFAMQG